MMSKAERRLLDTIHGAMSDAYAAGAVTKRTMRHFDRACLPSKPVIGPEAIRDLRDRENISQSAFAVQLGVTPGLVSKWERGEKRPSGPSLKLLDLVRRKGLDILL